MGSWQDTKHPHVFLKFETAALCEAGLSDLNVPKRQRPRWRVEVVDDTRLKLSYDDLIETCHHYMTNSIVKPYLGTQACKILAPDDAEKRPKRPPLEQTLSQTLGQAQALPRVTRGSGRTKARRSTGKFTRTGISKKMKTKRMHTNFKISSVEGGEICLHVQGLENARLV